MEKISKEKRRRIMQSIRGKDTKIEVTLRKELWDRGYRYRKNHKALPGKPDIVFLGKKIAIFCDGDFWHGKDWEKNRHRIKSNSDFWVSKIERNIQRDSEVDSALREMGWKVLRFWESEINENLDLCVKRIEAELSCKNPDKDKSKQKQDGC